jgi:acetyltransferase
MSQLTHLLKPKSVAVIGASSKPMRAGNIILKNLLQGGFEGAIMPVTPRYSSVCGVLAYRSIDELPVVPDVAIVCTNASRNIAIFRQLAEKQVKSVIVLSADMHLADEEGSSIQSTC